MDLTGHGRPDRVQTTNRTTAEPFDGPSWRVYENTGRGFAVSLINWSVPAFPVGRELCQVDFFGAWVLRDRDDESGVQR